jgi:hypothetical protein
LLKTCRFDPCPDYNIIEAPRYYGINIRGITRKRKKMVKDIKGREVLPKNRVVCIISSVVQGKMCTHPHNRPVGSKYWKEHTDVLLNKKSAEREGNKKLARVLTVKHISGDYVCFYNDKNVSEAETSYHYHPANRFMVVG